MRFTRILAHQFRESFSYPTKDVAHFFPGHMSRGMTQMQRILRDVDCVVEVHDSRIPFSGRNLNFSNTITLRPHLMVMNKMDLSDKRYFHQIESHFKDQMGTENFMFCNCKKDHHSTIKKTLINKLLEILTGSPRYHREGLEEYSVLVIGVPNVGKSSLINALRRTHMKKRKATPVGPHAGVTKSVMEKVRICDRPRIYLYDTPGITMPQISDMEQLMKLALCATLKDNLVGEEYIADYMLYWLNKHHYFKYVEYFNLPGPTDNILELLGFIARSENLFQKTRSATVGYDELPNYDMAAKIVLRAFRDGKLGFYNLDEDALTSRIPTG